MERLGMGSPESDEPLETDGADITGSSVNIVALPDVAIGLIVVVLSPLSPRIVHPPDDDDHLPDRVDRADAPQKDPEEGPFDGHYGDDRSLAFTGARGRRRLPSAGRHGIVACRRARSISARSWYLERVR